MDRNNSAGIVNKAIDLQSEGIGNRISNTAMNNPLRNYPYNEEIKVTKF